VKHSGLGRRVHLDKKLQDPALPEALLSIDTDKWLKHQRFISSDLHIINLETSAQNFANKKKTVNKSFGLAEVFYPEWTRWGT
jgi:hypothetical protein